MNKITCFWLEPTMQVQLSLRRTHESVSRVACDHPGNHGRHTVTALLHNGLKDFPSKSPEKHDPSWPTHCQCGYQFTEDDTWKLESKPLYMRADTLELVTLEEAPIGAMWNAYWMDGYQGFKMIDGVCLTLRTPGGDWIVDGPSYNDGIPGDGWTRTGEFRTLEPSLTVRPEIVQPTFRGWMTGGVLYESYNTRAFQLTNAANLVE